MNKIRGFTLVELLLVIILMGIALTLAIPTFQKFFISNQMLAQVNQMVTAINFARSEAIKNHLTVTLCASSDNHTCSEQWRDGWIVFLDKNNTGRVDDPGDTVLRSYNAIPAGDRLIWHSSLTKPYLQMSSSGSTRGQQGTFIYCPRNTKVAQFSLIKVSQTGRVRVAKNDGSDGKSYMCD